MKLLHAVLSKVIGRNLQSTPKEVILDQLSEVRPLPMGRKEFDEWSDRIISGALLPGGEEDKAAFIESQKFVLAEMLMHLGKTESHKPDAYFVHSLRKGAINQVAYAVMNEIRDAVKAKKEAEEKEAKEKEEKTKTNEISQ